MSSVFAQAWRSWACLGARPLPRGSPSAGRQKMSPGPGLRRQFSCNSVYTRSTGRTWMRFSISPTPGVGLRDLLSPRFFRHPSNSWARSISSKPINEKTDPNRKPQKELRFRPTDLSQAEVNHVFGRTINRGFGNRILRMVHASRVAGQSTEMVALPGSPRESRQLVEQAWAWLDQHHPLNRSTTPGAGGAPEESAGWASSSVYGESGLDAIRQHYRQRAEAEAEAKRRAEAEAERAGRPGRALRAAAREAEVAARKSEWIRPYQERATISDSIEAPAFSLLQRIGPSAIVTALVFGLAIFFAQNYTPPARDARIWPDLPPAAATVFGIMLINGLVFVAWRIPLFWGFLNRYAMSVPGYPFALSMIGSMFSHQSTLHLLMNMAVLWNIGLRVHEDVGRGNFLAIYLCSGVFGSFASLSSFVLRSNFTTSSLGASGALAGLIATFCSLHFAEPLHFILDVIPAMPAIALLGLMISVDVFGVLRGWRRLDHWAHLGGYATGITASLHLMKTRSSGASSSAGAGGRREKNWWEKIRDGR